MLELWKWTVFPGEEFRSNEHPGSTVELLAVLEGVLALEIGGVVCEPAPARSARTDAR